MVWLRWSNSTDFFWLMQAIPTMVASCKAMGSKRPLDITDSEAVEWTDLRGTRARHASLLLFAIHRPLADARVSYEPAGSNEGSRDWTFRTWPVDKSQVSRILSSCGMRLVQERVLGGTGKKLPVDHLLFKKTPANNGTDSAANR